MSKSNSYKDFLEKIASIEPSALNVFGTGIPGVIGASMAGRGGSTEADLIHNLNLETHKLFTVLSKKGPSEDIELRKQQVEAALKSCAVVGLIMEKDLDSIIVDLKNLR